MKIKIRPATREEAPQLSTIAVASKKYWRYPDKWFDLWGDFFEITPTFIDNNKVWVAENNGRIIAFVAISFSKKSAELEHMWVLPDEINKGVGTQLFAHILQFCREYQIESLRIESDPNAIRFYEKLGARQVGVVKAKPAPRVLPVLMMELQ